MTSCKRILSCLLIIALLLPAALGSGAPKAQAQSANLAYGKSVAFACNGEVITGDADYGLTAVKNGLGVLTDGNAYNPNWWVNNGNPYVALKSAVLAGPYIFSVDLAGQYHVDTVCVYSYGREEWGITPADSVTYTISADGTNWTTLGTVSLAEAQVTTIADPRYENSFVDIYAFRLPVSGEGRYVRATFSANAKGLVGIGEIEVCGTEAAKLLSSGAEITYFGCGSTSADANWGNDAVNAGLNVLTDGVSDSPNWWVNNGNPNIGLKSSALSGPYVFNLSLGGYCNVTEIATYFYSRTDWGVDRPDSVTYSISTDGILWREVGSVTAENAVGRELEDPRNPDAQKPTIYRFTLEMDAADAQYVKVTIPESDSGLMGLQEIEVRGVRRTITNLALGRMATASNYTYQITGGGTGYEAGGSTKPDGSRYTVTDVELNSASRLTDGTVINAETTTYPSGWGGANWNSTGTIKSKYLEIYRNDSRIITLDLGAVRNVTGIRMHFAALESAGFYMPTNVTYYLSEDGENYYEIADVWNYQALADANDSNLSGSGVPRHSWYAARNINFNARYVKVIFPVNVYILTDELQVYGSEVLSATPTPLTSCPKYDPLANYVGHFADLTQSGGVKNEFMAYSGWYINSDGSEVYNTYKTAEEYMCALAYVDGNGAPQDWLFDDITVMGHYYTSSGTFNSYKAGYTSGKYYADQDDWYEWLCYAFGKDANGNDLSYDGISTINLEALEEAAGIAKEQLNDPDYKVGVKLVLFPAVEYQEDWGYLDGKHIDFTISGAGSEAAALANRRAAYQWYVDTAVRMWEQANFQHLELTGFYYYEETIHESTDRIARSATQELTDIVHTHATPTTNTRPAFDSRQGGRLYIYQLPYYQSEGYWNWAEYGFDYALMQPNYSFYDMYTLTQLEECGKLCKYYGLGMQMEFGGTASTDYHNKFKDYLTCGDDFGYQNAVLSWYMSTWGCYSMANNANGTRYLYDMVYDFVKTQNENLISSCPHEKHTVDGLCSICLRTVEHSYVDGICTVCGEEQPAEKFDIDFAQVILGNALNVNFAFPVDAQDDWTSCYAVATKTYADGREDLTVTVPATEWKSATIQGAKHYYFSFSNVSGKEMADNIYVTIYNADDEAISNEYTESIRSYVMRILDDQDAATRTMLVDMLNYGSAAQASYTYGTDNLANSLLSETQKAYGSSTVKTCTDSRVQGANYQGTRLVLKNSILMQFGFSGLTADMTAKVEFTNHRGTKISETVAPVKLDNGAYAIEVNQIVAADGRIPVTVTVYDADGNVYGSATDSMESYIARMGTTDPLYAAIMMFSDAAYAYLH